MKYRKIILSLLFISLSWQKPGAGAVSDCLRPLPEGERERVRVEIPNPQSKPVVMYLSRKVAQDMEEFTAKGTMSYAAGSRALRERFSTWLNGYGILNPFSEEERGSGPTWFWAVSNYSQLIRDLGDQAVDLRLGILNDVAEGFGLENEAGSWDILNLHGDNPHALEAWGYLLTRLILIEKSSKDAAAKRLMEDIYAMVIQNFHSSVARGFINPDNLIRGLYAENNQPETKGPHVQTARQLFEAELLALSIAHRELGPIATRILDNWDTHTGAEPADWHLELVDRKREREGVDEEILPGGRSKIFTQLKVIQGTLDKSRTPGSLQRRLWEDPVDETVRMARDLDRRVIWYSGRTNFSADPELPVSKSLMFLLALIKRASEGEKGYRQIVFPFCNDWISPICDFTKERPDIVMAGMREYLDDNGRSGLRTYLPFPRKEEPDKVALCVKFWSMLCDLKASQKLEVTLGATDSLKGDPEELVKSKLPNRVIAIGFSGLKMDRPKLSQTCLYVHGERTQTDYDENEFNMRKALGFAVGQIIQREEGLTGEFNCVGVPYGENNAPLENLFERSDELADVSRAFRFGYMVGPGRNTDLLIFTSDSENREGEFISPELEDTSKPADELSPAGVGSSVPFGRGSRGPTRGVSPQVRERVIRDTQI